MLKADFLLKISYKSFLQKLRINLPVFDCWLGFRRNFKWLFLERLVQFTMINYQQGGCGGLAPPPPRTNSCPFLLTVHLVKIYYFYLWFPCKSDLYMYAAKTKLWVWPRGLVKCTLVNRTFSSSIELMFWVKERFNGREKN